MTTKEKLEEVLVSRGMFPAQAKAVIELAIPKIEAVVPDYRITWSRPAEEYPAPLYAVWMGTVNEVALEWIDANIPQAWFRPMFAPQPKTTP